MAWISSETKMDTGQLYVSTDDGKTFQKVCEVREVKTAQDALKHEEKVKHNLSHLIYLLTALGTDNNISVKQRQWCCDQLAEMYVNGDLKEVMDHVYLVMPRHNGKILFQHMLMERIKNLSFGFEQTNNPSAVVKLDNNNEKEKKQWKLKNVIAAVSFMSCRQQMKMVMEQRSDLSISIFAVLKI